MFKKILIFMKTSRINMRFNNMDKFIKFLKIYLFKQFKIVQKIMNLNKLNLKKIKISKNIINNGYINRIIQSIIKMNKSQKIIFKILKIRIY